MFGIVTCCGGKTRLAADRREGLSLCRLELKSTRHCKRWLRRLGKAGVYRVIVQPSLAAELSQVLRECGLEVVSGAAVLRVLSPRLALFAAEARGIAPHELGAEIYTGGKDALNAVRVCGERVKFISAIGRGAEEIRRLAYDKFGISVMGGSIPRGMCKNILRLYFDGREQLFGIKAGEEPELFFADAVVELPEKYRDICGADCAAAMAQALMECGRLRAEDLEIAGVNLL